MGHYILGRALQAVASLFVMSIIIFVLSRLPDDAAFVLLPDDAQPGQLDQITKELGLDKPLVVQYGIWLWNVFQGDLGNSTSRPALKVTEVVAQKIPNTFKLAGAGYIISLGIGIPIGIYAAAWRGKPFDLASRLFAVLGQAIPGFWLGILLIMTFGVWWPVLPAGGAGGLKHMILPAITIGWVTTAGVMRLTRSSMLEVLDSEYVKLARIKGVSERSVMWKHGLKNAALPVVTYAGLILILFVTGIVITETIFAWPGLGRMMFQAVISRDFPVMQGGVLFITSVYLFGNLLVDIFYAFLNPRIRYA